MMPPAAVLRGGLLSRIRMFIDRYISQPQFALSVGIGLTVFNFSNFLRTTIDGEYIPNTLLPFFSEVLYLLVSSVLIWATLVVMTTILFLMLIVLRGERRIVLPACKMVLLSAGVVAYHVNMLHYAYYKYANDFPVYYLIPLVIVYIMHAAVQMEAIFADLNCLRDEDVKLSIRSTSILSLLFNATMMIHFVSIVISWNRDEDWWYMIILFGFELVHRALALYTFVHLLWLHLWLQEELHNNEELAHGIEEIGAINQNAEQAPAQVDNDDQFYIVERQSSLTRHRSVPVVPFRSLPQEPQEDKLYTTPIELPFPPLTYKQTIVVQDSVNN